MAAPGSRARAARVALVTGLMVAGIISPAPATASVDGDRDGLPDWFELYRSRTSSTRADTDRDGIPDGREDPDRDGLTNRQELVAGLHPRRADTDGDGIVDAREDLDRDGLWTIMESRARTHPLRWDTDRDGRSDAGEDGDGDGLSNLVEQRIGTNPGDADTDDDGYSDGLERAAGSSPRDPASVPDASEGSPVGSGGSGSGGSGDPGTTVPVLPDAPACPVFPADNVWNLPVDALPVAPNSSTLVASIGLDAGLHADFGSYAGYGIPYTIATSSTQRSTVAFDYADESDQVGYPIPADPLVEGGSDHHIVVVERDACRLYELWDARRVGSGWAAGSGATWDLRSNALRPDGWTSADAAGLAILPGLVRYDEVAAGVIRHALRFTAPRTRRAYVYPARHFASSSTDASLPPMGLRVRLKRSADVSGFSPQARVILEALQRYGMLLADNGSAWYVSGVSHSSFDDGVLHELGRITGRDLEVVDTSGLVNGP